TGPRALPWPKSSIRRGSECEASSGSSFPLERVWCATHPLEQTAYWGRAPWRPGPARAALSYSINIIQSSVEYVPLLRCRWAANAERLSQVLLQEVEVARHHVPVLLGAGEHDRAL